MIKIKIIKNIVLNKYKDYIKLLTCCTLIQIALGRQILIKILRF